MFGLNVALTSLLEELQLILFFETVPFPCFRLFLKKFRLRCCVDNQFHSPACFWLALVKAGSLMRLTSYWKLFTLLVNHWIKKQELKLFLSRRDLKSCLKLRRAWIMKPTQDSTALCYFMQDSANSDKFARKICCIVHFSSRDGGSAAKVFHNPEQMSPLAGCSMGRYFE